MIALIDADVVVWRVGFTTMEDSEGIAKARADDTLDLILEDTKASEYELWLSDSTRNTFRYSMWPEYKANRIGAPKPIHYDVIKEHLIKEWGARIAVGMEADDALGIRQDKADRLTLICSVDKDLLQIPGLHYNFVKKEWTEVSSWDGLKWFYQQLLIGDASDNIKGCTGIGAKKAEKAIGPISFEEGESRLLEVVFDLFKKKEKAWSPQRIKEHLEVIGGLLRILQTEEEPRGRWNFQALCRTEELKSLFIPSPEAGNVLSTEPTSQETKSMDGFPQHGPSTEPRNLALSAT